MRAALALVPAMILGACNHAEGGTHDGDHRKISQNFPVGAFSRIALGGSTDVVVTVGGAPSVRAEGDAERIGRMEIQVEGDQLMIGSKRHGWNWGDGKGGPVTVYVTLPSLAAASIGGSGDMKIDKVEGGNFSAQIGGSGDMQIASLQAGEANVSLAGSGSVTAGGKAQHATLSIAGSGDIDLGNLEVRTANVSVGGSGNAAIKAMDGADVSIMGSGDVTVTGGGKCQTHKMGSGNVNCG
jgi:Putative auto-transporter adhesin, head GIN domain